jgi:hypothetical protein
LTPASGREHPSVGNRPITAQPKGENSRLYLSEADSRLIVIGYGFADRHINDSIIRAAGKNPTMRLFPVDPAGRAILPSQSLLRTLIAREQLGRKSLAPVIAAAVPGT